MNLARSLSSISFYTLLSRLLGFVRDILITQVFGATCATDAFWVAFRIPNLLRRIFAEGAFSQAFIPLLSDVHNKKNRQQAVLFTQRVCGLLSVILLLITVIGILASPWIIRIIARGFSEDKEQFYLASNLLKITFPYIFFISLTSFFSAILNTHNKFFVSAITPIFLNISLIIFTVGVSPYLQEPIYALAWGVFIAGVIQLIFQFPFVFRLGYLKKPLLALKDPEILKIIRNMALIVIGVSAGQLSILINSLYLSYMVEGSVSWQYVSDRLMELPSGLLGVALGTVLLPTLSRFAAQKNYADFSDLLDWGLRLAMLLALPAALGLALLAYPVVSTLFQHGHFRANDVLHTYPAVLAYTLAIPGFIWVKILVPGFTARQDYRTPIRIGFFILLLTQTLNVFFVLVAHWGIVGINLSTSLASLANATILYTILRYRNLYQPKKDWRLFLKRVVIALFIMAAFLYGLQKQTFYPFLWHQGIVRDSSQLLILIGGAVTIYFFSLFCLGFGKKDFLKQVNNP